MKSQSRRTNSDGTDSLGPARLFRHAFESSASGMAVVDLDGRYLQVNSALCSMLGYTEKEMLDYRFQDVTHPDDVDDDLDLLRRTLEGQLDSGRREKRYLHKLGHVVWGLISFSLVRNSRNEPLCFIVQVQDITERRQAEQRLKSSHEQMRRLSCHLQSVREEERAQVAREIHDQLGQSLTALKLDLAWLEGNLEEHQSDLRRQTGRMSNMVDQTIESLRQILTSLRPALLDDLGLTAAIEWQAREFQERTSTHCRLQLTQQSLDLSRDQNIALFRIFQETLTNVARHAGARNVLVSLRLLGESVILTVRDDGRGIPPETDLNAGLGILGMKERAGILGGRVEISPRQSGGTQVMVQIPLQAPSASP